MKVSVEKVNQILHTVTLVCSTIEDATKLFDRLSEGERVIIQKSCNNDEGAKKDV